MVCLCGRDSLGLKLETEKNGSNGERELVAAFS